MAILLVIVFRVATTGYNCYELIRTYAKYSSKAHFSVFSVPEFGLFIPFCVEPRDGLTYHPYMVRVLKTYGLG